MGSGHAIVCPGCCPITQLAKCVLKKPPSSGLNSSRIGAARCQTNIGLLTHSRQKQQHLYTKQASMLTTIVGNQTFRRNKLKESDQLNAVYLISNTPYKSHLRRSHATKLWKHQHVLKCTDTHWYWLLHWKRRHMAWEEPISKKWMWSDRIVSDGR